MTYIVAICRPWSTSLHAIAYRICHAFVDHTQYYNALDAQRYAVHTLHTQRPANCLTAKCTFGIRLTNYDMQVISTAVVRKDELPRVTTSTGKSLLVGCILNRLKLV